MGSSISVHHTSKIGSGKFQTIPLFKLKDANPVCPDMRLNLK